MLVLFFFQWVSNNCKKQFSDSIFSVHQVSVCIANNGIHRALREHCKTKDLLSVFKLKIWGHAVLSLKCTWSHTHIILPNITVNCTQRLEQKMDKCLNRVGFKENDTE